ncbi:MAG: hypothetical protein WCX28_11525 [Bacteriovoracaceae bacterium]
MAIIQLNFMVKKTQRIITAVKLQWFFAFALIVVRCSTLSAQEKHELHFTVSYVAASVVYINSGREGNIAVGDTVSIQHASVRIGVVVVTAVSKKSSAAQIVSQTTSIAAGDEAVLVKIIEKEESPFAAVKKNEPDTLSGKSAILVLPVTATMNENLVTGRAGLQYIGTLAEDSRLNLSQPSVVLRLNIQNVYNTGLVFSLYGRTYYDLSDIYSRYGDKNRMKNRMYDFSLQKADANAPMGYGIGRLSSEYVGGMGTFDGGQFFYRYDNFTSGFLYGAKVQDRTIGIDANETKGAFFVNAKFGSDFLHQYSGTVAYGRQLVKGNMDREFFYLQNFFMMGSELSFYESSEFELNDIDKGVKSRTFKLSNTFFSINYYPLQWLSSNIGYDGTRSVYLFESMKSISDTLLDKNIMNGFRAGATIRLPYFMSLSGNISYRSKKGDSRDSRNISGTYRISDLLQTEIGAGLRYADIRGVYSDGTNITFDLDRTFFSAMSLALRYDYYKYSILVFHQSYTTHTLTLNSSYRFSKRLFSSFAVDGILDNTMNSVRVYAELGYRF